MATTPLLDFEALLAPVPGDNPAGTSVPFEIRAKLEEMRKEENPEDYEPNDPRRPEKFKTADWLGIVRLAQETLTQTSKDMLVAARLTEALVKLNGFAGLRDGLHLQRMLVEQCWDRLHPPIEDGDVEVRGAGFGWLGEYDRGARFPVTVQRVPLMGKPAETQYGWLDWKNSQEPKGSLTKEDIEKAIQVTPAELAKDSVDNLDGSLAELTKLDSAFSAKMGEAAPKSSGLRAAVEGCATLAKHVAQRVTAWGPAMGPESGAGAGGFSGSGVAASRESAYRQLAQAAAVLKQLEPHSPIPYFIERAVKLGSLSFPEMIRELIREQGVLTELHRLLGLKEPPPSG